MRPPAARSISSPRPGPGRVGQQQAAGPVEDGGQGAGGSRRAIDPRSASAQASAATRPRQRPARLAGGGPQVRLGRRRLADEHRRQLAAAGAGDVLDLGLRLRVALDRVGGELVDVGEDRLGEQAQLLGVEAGAPGRGGDPPPGDPGPDPVGGLQRVEGPALAQLAAAERDVDLAADPAPALRVADQGDELAQRFLDAGADPAAEAALERPRVLGHLAGDRRQGLGGDRVELGLDQSPRPARRGRARAPDRRSADSVFVI